MTGNVEGHKALLLRPQDPARMCRIRGRLSRQGWAAPQSCVYSYPIGARGPSPGNPASDPLHTQSSLQAAEYTLYTLYPFTL